MAPATSPLIGETIGVHFDRIVERFRRARRADRPPSADTLDLSRAAAARSTPSPPASLALGLKPGERVGIWSPNNAEWVVTQFATAKAGLILVNINPAYRRAELEYALNKSGCTALITAARFKTSDYLGMLRELAPELAHRRRRAICAPPSSPICAWSSPSGTRAAPGMIRFDDVCGLGGRRRAPQARRARRGRCNSTTRSTSSSPAAPPAFPRARRSPTTTS